MSRSIRATIHQTPGPDTHEVLADRVITWDAHGSIEAVEAVEPVGGRHTDVERLDEGVLIVPGFVDAHVHAPQWPQLGIGLDLTLERWLLEYTFPLESRYADTAFAADVWDQLVPALLRHGTTTAVYHSSRHLDATTELASACRRHGQRALIGRVAMDHTTGTPDWYRDPDATAAVELSAASIDAIRDLDPDGALVAPIVTPRFIPACSDDGLAGLGALAAARGVATQTHCSESDWQHAAAFERFGTSDTTALDSFGLVRDGTVLAHATHLDDGDRATIASRGAGIAHCPLSNAHFSERPFAARRAIVAGIPCGLGTDIAGGPSPSLIGQCEQAAVASRQLAAATGDPNDAIDATTAFWMATRGGALAAGLDVGLIGVGRPFDAVAVRTDDPAGVGAGPDEDPETVFERVVRRAGRADIVAVWVAGRRVV